MYKILKLEERYLQKYAEKNNEQTFLRGQLQTKSFIKKWLKCNIKAFFIGGLISLVITVSATIILHSNQVEYKDGKSVETAVNELYEKHEQIKALEMTEIGCEGCTKLEYLESNGTQYVNTDVITSNSIKVETKVETIVSD